MIELYYDERGTVGSLWRAKDYRKLNFVEDRISKSRKGVIRGFHGDPFTLKLVLMVEGTAKFVIYDILDKGTRKYILTPGMELLIPAFSLNAHQALTDCTFIYKWTKYYDLTSQWSVHYNDKTINPMWDESIPPIVSERDKNAPTLEEWSLANDSR